MINRILIVGYGSIGKKHLSIARTMMPKSDIRILRHKVTKYQPRFSNGTFSDIDQALKFKPQIAVIANPSNLHIPIAIKLAAQGVHILIEKPISNNLDNLNYLLEIAKKKQVKILTGYNLRFVHSLKFFRNAIKEKAIGKVFSVNCEVGQYLPNWRKNKKYNETVSAKSKLGGGVLLELSHELDYLRWIFGEVKWVKASSSKQSNLEIDVEDTVKIIMQFQSEVIASVNLDFIRHDSTRSCSVIGENGTLRWNGLTGITEIYKSDSKTWKVIFNDHENLNQSYISEWKNFLDCVLHDTLPVVSGDDGLKVLEIIDGVKKSATFQGQLINLNQVLHINNYET